MRNRLLFLGAGLLVVTACRGRDDLDGSRRPIPGLVETSREYQLDRHGLRLAYDFYDNRAVAGIHVGGRLRIDAGSVEFVKYIDGGYRTRWHLGVEDGGHRAALIDGLATGLGFTLTLVLLGAARELLGRGTLLSQAGLMFGSSGESLKLTLIPNYDGFLPALLPPGAFILLGLLIAGRNGLEARRKAASRKPMLSEESPA